MNNKKTEQVVLNERAQDLRTLLVYYSVTRVVNSFLDKSGGFSMQMFRNVRGWLKHWKEKTPMEKARDAKKYNEKRRKWNEVLGIPHQLMNAVLGRYWKDGKSIRVKFEDALNVIGGTTVWEVKDNGQSAYTNENGDRVVKAHWSRKVYPANNKEWNKLLFTSENYHLETLQRLKD